LERHQYNDNTLILFTNNYPYDNGEAFIENEIIFLSQSFKHIYIIPFYNEFTQTRKVPVNCKVLNIDGFNELNGKKTFVKYFFRFCFIYFREFFLEKNKKGFWKLKKELRSKLLQSLFRADKLSKLLSDNNIERPLLYSFWCNDWVTILGLLNKKNDLKVITRVHGFDLYHARRKNNILPFRNFQLKKVEAVFCVSEFGRKYLQKSYPAWDKKYFVAPLYVPDRGTNPFEVNKEYTIVSCSNIIPLKRVEYIARSLSHIKENLKWIHFGDGEMDQINKLITSLPLNIKVEMRGNIPNSELIDFYRNQCVHVFVHVSSSEGGIPVAIQEAISFGIPVIAVANGGIPEIVNETTGVLIQEDFFTIEKLSAEMVLFFKSNKNSIEYRNGIKRFWSEYFSAEKNYPDFCKHLRNDL
jgi:glycosyltransferase involved in cell wall biosynthesis